MFRKGCFYIFLMITIVTSLFFQNIYKINASHSELEIISHSYFVQFGYSHIVGEMQNIGTHNLENIIITAIFYDENNTILTTGFSYVKSSILVPQQKSPFEISSSPEYDLQVDHYEIIISDYSVTNFKPYRSFTFQEVTTEIQDGYFTIFGEVKNTGSTLATWVRVIATFYDIDGKVIGLSTTNLDPGEIEPNQSSPFEIDTYPRIYTPADYSLQVECRESSLPPSSITCEISESALYLGQRLTVSGAISPKAPNAYVILRYSKPDGSSFTRTKTTDSNGIYTDTYRPDMVGSWTVDTRWEGNDNYTGSSSTLQPFKVYSKKSTSLFFSILPITVHEKENVTIIGTINPPIPEINIVLIITRPDKISYNITIKTRADGSFNHTHTPSFIGTWTVKATWPGDEKYEGSTSQTVTFNVIEVPGKGSLNIFVQDRDGAPISGADVTSISQPDGQQALNGSSDDDGLLTFNEIKIGNYMFEISKIGYITKTMSVSIITEEITDIIIRLEEKIELGILKIMIIDYNDNPLSGSIVISTSQPNGQPILQGTTDSDGIVLFKNITFGNYIIQATKNGYKTEIWTGNITNREIKEVTIIMEKEQKFPIEIIVSGSIFVSLLFYLLYHMRSR